MSQLYKENVKNALPVIWNLGLQKNVNIWHDKDQDFSMIKPRKYAWANTDCVTIYKDLKPNYHNLASFQNQSYNSLKPSLQSQNVQ